MSLIVIEGVDGAGKATQTALTVQNLNSLGKKADSISFPSYGQYSAIFVEKFLNGEFGPMGEVDPYVASSFYILDRFGQKRQILDKLVQNDFLVSDRYSISNFLHRGVKFLQNDDTDGMREFFERVYDFEFNKAELPVPDHIFFLSLSIPNIQKLLLKKQAQDREYVNGGGLDIAEKDIQHQTLSLQVGREVLPSYFPNYTTINCEDEQGNILTPDQINLKILEKIT